MINISLSPTAFIWFLSDSKIHLSEEHPGPLEIDFCALSKEHQKHTILAIRTGQIKCSEPVNNLMLMYNNVSPPAPLAPVVETPTILYPTDDKPELIKLLGKSIGTVKKYIGLCGDIRKLRLMLELEKENRARKPIVSALQNKLSTFTQSINNNIVTNQSTYVPETMDNIDKLAVNMDIVDSDEEIVKIVKQ